MEAPSVMVAVLAGGRGRRLGGEKPRTPLAGVPLIEYPLRAAAESGLETFVVAKPDSPLPALSVPVVHEPPFPRHPLRGLITALEHARARRGEEVAVLGVACDMPLLTAELLRWLASQEGAAVAWNADGPQPSLCRCAVAHLPALRESLARSEPLTKALLALGPRVVDEQQLARFGEPERLCFNVNSPLELERAEGWLAQSPAAMRAAASRS